MQKSVSDEFTENIEEHSIYKQNKIEILSLLMRTLLRENYFQIVVMTSKQRIIYEY